MQSPLSRSSSTVKVHVFNLFIILRLSLSYTTMHLCHLEIRISFPYYSLLWCTYRLEDQNDRLYKRRFHSTKHWFDFSKEHKFLPFTIISFIRYHMSYSTCWIFHVSTTSRNHMHMRPSTGLSSRFTYVHTYIKSIPFLVFNTFNSS